MNVVIYISYKRMIAHKHLILLADIKPSFDFSFLDNKLPSLDLFHLQLKRFIFWPKDTLDVV